MFTGEPLYRQLVIYFTMLGVKSIVVANTLACVGMHESSDGTSNIAKTCNNVFGITYAGQSGATACSRSQKQNEGGLSMAKYATLKDCCADFLRIMRMNRSGQGAPLDSYITIDVLGKKTLTFNVPLMVERMKANGYFGDSVQNYTRAVIGKLKKYAEKYLKAGLQLENKQNLEEAVKQSEITPTPAVHKYAPEVPLDEAIKQSWKEDVVQPITEVYEENKDTAKAVLWGLVGLGIIMVITRR